MSACLFPVTFDELIQLVQSTPRVIPVGRETKRRLSAVQAVRLSTAELKGITEYDPSEYTFTALAGTTLREVAAELAGHGQYLPFDPPLVAGGATLGGTVASGLSGPGRFRFGGIRDFILGVKFVNGSGKLLRMGGKVVKNAAGFDLPKFFVGSLGRLGVLAELTFKVFPRPSESLTLRLDAKNTESAAQILIEAGNSRWEPHALDVLPQSNHVLLRLAGPAAALDTLALEILARWPGARLRADEADSMWNMLREFQWAHSDGELVKTAITAKKVPPLSQALEKVSQNTRCHISSGGNVAFISLPSREEAPALENVLGSLDLRGVTLRGSGPLWYGNHQQTKIAHAVKEALDPVNRFPSLED